MKKLILTLMILEIFAGISFAKPPQFEDQEEILVQGNRPYVDVEVSELIVEILPEDFINGIATKEVEVTNAGNVAQEISIEVGHVPSDLDVKATVDDDILEEGQSTTLIIEVSLTEMFESTKFEFSVLVKAERR